MQGGDEQGRGQERPRRQHPGPGQERHHDQGEQPVERHDADQPLLQEQAGGAAGRGGRDDEAAQHEEDIDAEGAERADDADVLAIGRAAHRLPGVQRDDAARRREAQHLQRCDAPRRRTIPHDAMVALVSSDWITIRA